MVDAGFLTGAHAADIQPQRVLPRKTNALPAGTYFADWVLPAARDAAGEVQSETTVETTLEPRLQRAAERAIGSAGLRQAQAALVAMRPDGRVVAIVGGRDYAKSPFNRATNARRQPGSAFKLFVYLAALRAGKTPSDTVDDSPIDFAGWKPKNDDGRYLGEISLARAFARSSNVAAARLTQEVGVKAVIKAARDLGISTPIANEATISLGTAGVSLLELTAAYAAIADGHYPVRPRGIDKPNEDAGGTGGWLKSLTGGSTEMPDEIRENMLSLLNSAIRGTGREANLPIKAYGKTGTSQDERDGWFIGFAGDLVVGVWVGNDDNTPNPGLHGGTIPARIWHAFMQSALNLPPPAPTVVEEQVDNAVVGNEEAPFEAEMEGLGINLKVGPDGGISVGPAREREERPPSPDERAPPPEDEEVPQ